MSIKIIDSIILGMSFIGSLILLGLGVYVHIFPKSIVHGLCVLINLVLSEMGFDILIIAIVWLIINACFIVNKIESTRNQIPEKLIQ